jgi:photosystem II stability/assembly factor-like uncharacterized protein
MLVIPLAALPAARGYAAEPGVSAPVAQEAGGDMAAALENIAWRNIGPAIMGGRITDLAVLESNPSVFFVATATGGLWKTVNHGIAFEPVFDNEETSSIGTVSISQSNPNLVWVGSGEPQNRQSSPWGNGVYKSVDGGRSWEHKGLYETRHIARIVIDPVDNDVVYVAAVGQLWASNLERGVFRTRDGGDTWEHVLAVDADTGAIDLVMDPNDPNTLFAAMYQRRRTSFGFNGGGPGSGIYRSMDGGDTWRELTDGLPEGNKGRIGLDIFRGDSNLVYAIVEARRGDQGVYRSTDRGDTWEHLSTTNNRPMYYSLLRIDPNNPERIYLGGSSLYKTDDGGRNFTNDAASEVHSDHHALWIDPSNSDHLILGGDGGVSVSWDRSESWFQFTNMILAQFYEIGVDMRDPYYVCGGLQDNGSWCGPSATWSRQGIRNADWYNVGGGDGFYVRIDPADATILFAESQGGNIARVDLSTMERRGIRPVPRLQGEEPDVTGEVEFRWNWNTPILISQHDNATLYAGSNHLMRSTDRGMSWEAISPDLTQALDRDELEILGVPLGNDQILSRNDGISSYGNATTISESPIDPGVLYFGTDDGNLQGTRDGGANWQVLNQDMPGLPENTYVSRVVASRFNEGTVYATFDGHERGDYRPYVYVSDNFGEDWRTIVGGLPDDWSVNVIYEHPTDEELLFLGNEVGIYFSVDRGATWIRLKGNLPTVPVDDIVVHPRENDLIIGTHGRGAWILDDITPLEEISEDLVARDVHLFPVRRATIINLYSPQGWTPGSFSAPNPPFGAMIRYYLKEDAPLPERTGRQQAEPGPEGPPGMPAGMASFFRQGGQPAPRPEPPQPTVKLRVLDALGTVVRDIEGPGRAGMQQVVWDLRMNPAYVPDPSEDDSPMARFFRGSPEGPRVLPGIYTVELEAAGQTLSTEVEVRGDPRIDISRADLEARQAAILDGFALAKPIYEAGHALTRASDQLAAVRELIMGNHEVPDSVREEIRELSGQIRDLQGELNQVRRSARAASAIESFTALPTEDQLWQIDQAWVTVPDLVSRVNDLITGPMPALLGQIYQPGFGPAPQAAIEVPPRPGR